VKRVWLTAAAFVLSSCSGGPNSNVPSSTLPSANAAKPGVPMSRALRYRATGSCTFAQTNDPGQNLQQPVGKSTSDMWAIESATSNAAEESTDVAHFVNGVKVASYTMPGAPAGTVFQGAYELALVDGVPWAVVFYSPTNPAQTTYAVARFDGSKFVTYPIQSPSTGGLIGGSLSTGVYLAGDIGNGQPLLRRFNGSAFVTVATSNYSNLFVSSMAVFGKDVYILMNSNTNNMPYVAHWNGSTFAFHELKSANGQYPGEGVQITGASATDVWANSGEGIWHYNGNWQPYAFDLPASYYMAGIAEFNPKYVVVVDWGGTNNTPGVLVYNGVDRFLPAPLTPANPNTQYVWVSGIPGTTSLYAQYYYYDSNISSVAYAAGLMTCPATPPA
jgi:hypothetical protein